MVARPVLMLRNSRNQAGHLDDPDVLARAVVHIDHEAHLSA